MVKSLSDKIKEARLDAKLTQKQLSEKLNCTEVMISRYELGAVSVSVDRLRQIAEALGIPLSSFFDDDDGPRKKKKNSKKRL